MESGRQEIRIAGFGGQGVVLAGIVLARAGMLDGRQVVQNQSYGAEARGGGARAEVILADATLSQTTFDTLMYGHEDRTDAIGIAELAGIASVDFTAADMAGIDQFDEMFSMADLETFYRHSLFLEGGEGWPWVGGSGVRGIRSATLGGIKPGSYRVRLVFCEPEGQDGSSVFSVAVNGEKVAGGLDVVREAGGVRKGYVLEVASVGVGADGNLRIDLRAEGGETVLSGIELRRVDH